MIAIKTILSVVAIFVILFSVAPILYFLFKTWSYYIDKIHELSILGFEKWKNYYIQKNDLKKSIEIEKNKNSLKRPKGKTFAQNYVAQSLIVACICAIIFIVIAIICDKCFDFNYEAKENVVLSLVGILATFIVVLNHAQVVEIKKEMEQKISQLRRINFVRRGGQEPDHTK